MDLPSSSFLLAHRLIQINHAPTPATSKKTTAAAIAGTIWVRPHPPLLLLLLLLLSSTFDSATEGSTSVTESDTGVPKNEALKPLEVENTEAV